MSINYLLVADWFVKKALTQSRYINSLKIQKLVYLAHGWNLGVNDCPLIPESFEAWRRGPILPPLEDRLKSFGDDNITEELCSENIDDAFINSFLEFIWDRYSELSASELELITSKKGSPWDITVKSCNNTFETKIPNEIMRCFYLNEYISYIA